MDCCGTVCHTTCNYILISKHLSCSIKTPIYLVKRGQWNVCHKPMITIGCRDRKSRAAYVQSFALWQQATIKFTCHDHSIIACSHHIHIFLFFACIPFMVNHTINATPLERLQQGDKL